MPVLILAYYSIKDPIFQSAVLQYFKAYSGVLPCKFILVTFEHGKYPLAMEESSSIQNELSEYNIEWHRLHWHSGRFKMLKKAYDLLTGLVTIRRLKKFYGLKSIYSEGFPGAIIGYLACSAFNMSHVIHTFEPHADYMLEAGTWSRLSWEYRLLKYFEQKIALQASWIMTATSGMMSRIESWGVNRQHILKVPSCVNTNLFKPDPGKRPPMRSMLGFQKDDVVIVYLGKLGGMYWEEEFFECIKNFVGYKECRYRFLVLTNDDHKEIQKQLGKYTSHVRLLSVNHSEVNSYLQAGDMGLVAVRQRPSKAYCSPIKTGEYLASGLPVIIPSGISDNYTNLKDAGLAVVLEDTTHLKLSGLPARVQRFLAQSNHQQRAENAYQFARSNLSLHQYAQAYLKAFSGKDFL